MWSSLKNGLQNLGNFFIGLFNLTSYPDLQKQMTESLREVSAQMEKIHNGLEATEKQMKKLSDKMDSFDNELSKIKTGLQLELFESLHGLRTRIIKKHFATKEEKEDAKRFYDQIHELGKDGYSEQCYLDIQNAPESKEEYYSSLVRNK